MSEQMDRIPVPEKLDDVIRDSIGQLKRERRRKRMRAAAGIASAAAICMAGYAAGRYGVDSDMKKTAEADREENRLERDWFLAQNEEVQDAAYVGNVCLQESQGITVTTSNVYHNQYTLYMTVVIRGGEDFPEAAGQTGTAWKGTVRLKAEGKAEIGEKQIVLLPELVDGGFLDQRTFTGTVRLRLPLETSEIPETFPLEWKASEIELESEDGEKTAYSGDWEFNSEVHRSGGRTECGYGGVNESGEGIGQIVRTEEDITAEKLLPGNEGTEDYEIVMCDASGALMNRAGDYYRTENRDISTVYIFLCTSEDFSVMTEYYQSEKYREGARGRTFAQLVEQRALYSAMMHYESEYLSVYQQA